ncbi:transmembrane protein 207 [Choloepus didactylus]|uniref:transmembrane protein 207 n=1 Tax=Choloepus didactylus TaxID=27675 RepID=UPI0018A0FB6E|nr:transmembrane protein 207 [Choloepus didactylus]
MVFHLIPYHYTGLALKRCKNYNDQHPNGWYIWFLLLIFLVALLFGAVLFCLHCWLKRPRISSPRCTMAVFAVGDLDPAYGIEAAVSPTVGIHLQIQNPELYHFPCFGTLGLPPPYEEIHKISQF